MKSLKLLALFAGAVVLPWVIWHVRRRRASQQEEAIRYDLNEYLAETGL